MRREMAAGINAELIVFRVDAFASQVSEEGLFVSAQCSLIEIEADLSHRLGNLAPLLVCDLALQIDKLVGVNDTRVIGTKSTQSERQLRFGHALNGRGRSARRGLIRKNQDGIGEEPLDRNAGCEAIAVDIKNITPARLLEKDALSVVVNDVLVLVVPDHLEHVETCAQADERQSCEDGEDEQAPQMVRSDHGLVFSCTSCTGNAFVTEDGVG